MWEQYNILILICFAALAVALSHKMVGNGIYLMFTHWRESTFLILCALAGTTFAIKKDAIGHEVSHLYIRIQDPASANVTATIDSCKNFVSAKLNGSPPLTQNLRGNPWESCARTFGMNYWKYDISIDGRNGGSALCEAYQREAAHLSLSRVQAWCDTVFASSPPAGEQTAAGSTRPHHDG